MFRRSKSAWTATMKTFLSRSCPPPALSASSQSQSDLQVLRPSVCFPTGPPIGCGVREEFCKQEFAVDRLVFRLWAWKLASQHHRNATEQAKLPRVLCGPRQTLSVTTRATEMAVFWQKCPLDGFAKRQNCLLEVFAPLFNLSISKSSLLSEEIRFRFRFRFRFRSQACSQRTAAHFGPPRAQQALSLCSNIAAWTAFRMVRQRLVDMSGSRDDCFVAFIPSTIKNIDKEQWRGRERWTMRGRKRDKRIYGEKSRDRHDECVRKCLGAITVIVKSFSCFIRFLYKVKRHLWSSP